MRGLPELVPSIASVSVRIELSFPFFYLRAPLESFICGLEMLQTITNLLAVTGSKIRQNRF